MAWSVGLSWQVLVGLSWALWGRWRQQPRLVRPLMLFLAGCGVAVELAVYSIWEAGLTAEESLWIGCYFLASLVGKRLPGVAWWLALLGGLLGGLLLGGHSAALASLPGAVRREACTLPVDRPGGGSRPTPNADIAIFFGAWL